jgi:hypothetical protein
LLGFEHGVESGNISGWKLRFGNIPGVTEYSEQLLKHGAKDSEHWLTQFRDLERASSGGGVICQFEWSD